MVSSSSVCNRNATVGAVVTVLIREAIPRVGVVATVFVVVAIFS